MCVPSGNNLQKWNVAGRVLGDKGFKMLDPVTRAQENFVARRLNSMNPYLQQTPNWTTQTKTSTASDSPATTYQSDFAKQQQKMRNTMLAGGSTNVSGSTLLGG